MDGEAIFRKFLPGCMITHSEQMHELYYNVELEGASRDRAGDKPVDKPGMKKARSHQKHCECDRTHHAHIYSM